jgi:hypothetical protein
MIAIEKDVNTGKYAMEEIEEGEFLTMFAIGEACGMLAEGPVAEEGRNFAELIRDFYQRERNGKIKYLP